MKSCLIMAEYAAGEIDFVKLPSEITDHILSYLSYEEISSIRMVSQSMDRQCQQMLNLGFSKVDKFHSLIQKNVKAKLPRRESERRSHPLARHVDILAAVETRLSLLSMTYMKYIDVGLCCFIPGKVLDEMLRVLRIVKTSTCPPRPHELLTELRDISSMAMEQFDEKIAPRLKNLMNPVDAVMAIGVKIPSPPAKFECSSNLCLTSPDVRPSSIRQEMSQLRHNLHSASTSVMNLRKELNDYRNLTNEQRRKMQEQDKKILDLTQVAQEMKKKMNDQDHMMKDIHNKMTEIAEKVTGFASSSSSVTSKEMVAQVASGISLPGPSEPYHMDGAVIRPEVCDQEDSNKLGHLGDNDPSKDSPANRDLPKTKYDDSQIRKRKCVDRVSVKSVSKNKRLKRK